MLVRDTRWDTKSFALYGALLGLVGGMTLNFFDAFWGQVSDDASGHACTLPRWLSLYWQVHHCSPLSLLSATGSCGEVIRKIFIMKVSQD